MLVHSCRHPQREGVAHTLCYIFPSIPSFQQDQQGEMTSRQKLKKKGELAIGYQNWRRHWKLLHATGCSGQMPGSFSGHFCVILCSCGSFHPHF